MKHKIKENKGAIISFGLGIVLASILYYGYKNIDLVGFLKPGPTSNQKNWDSDNILLLPGKDASDSERAAHFQAALKIAVETATIEINNCIANPKVVKIAKDSSLTFKNASKNDYELLFGDQTSNLPAEKTISLKPNLDKGPGLYGYGCDDMKNNPINSGIIILKNE